MQQSACLVVNLVTIHVAQLVTCLTADPGVASTIQVWSHSFMDIDYVIVFTAILHGC